MAGRKGRSGGRNCKSPAAHKLHGTHRKDRHAGKRPPKPTKGRPTAPADLAGRALAEWRRLSALLEASEVLTVADGAMLYQYCVLFADAEDVKDALASVSKRLGHVKRPVDREYLESYRMKLWSQARAYRQAIRMFLIEFGLSPTSRNRVDLSVGGARDEVADDPFARFDTPPRRPTLIKTSTSRNESIAGSDHLTP